MDRDHTPDVRELESTPAKEIDCDPKGRDKQPERPDRYSITQREQETLFDIGRFRTVAVEDLVNHRYDGKGSETCVPCSPRASSSAGPRWLGKPTTSLRFSS